MTAAAAARQRNAGMPGPAFVDQASRRYDVTRAAHSPPSTELSREHLRGWHTRRCGLQGALSGRSEIVPLPRGVGRGDAPSTTVGTTSAFWRACPARSLTGPVVDRQDARPGRDD